MKTPDIEIICPNCKKKAAYFANQKAPTYKIQPGREGKAVCINCGYINKNFKFSTDNYYYKFEIKNRFLYARNFENLLFLKQYFETNSKIYSDPDLDFPKVFYENRNEIVNKIKKVLKP